jgi:hypothetical protein
VRPASFALLLVASAAGAGCDQILGLGDFEDVVAAGPGSSSQTSASTSATGGSGGASTSSAAGGGAQGGGAQGGGGATTGGNGGGGNGGSGGGGNGGGGSGGGGPLYRVFVTNTQVGLPFGNQPASAITAADDFCAGAASAQLPGSGTFFAWFTNAVRPDMSAVLSGGGPWHLVQPNGSADPTAPVASSYADIVLCDGDENACLDREIDRTEIGAGGISDSVWTGSSPSGQSTLANCADWTATSGTASVGATSESDSQWTDAAMLTCLSLARLYCFEMP